jgi:hypothetical protein
MTEHDISGMFDPPPVDDGGIERQEPWALRDEGPDTEEILEIQRELDDLDEDEYDPGA